MEDPEIAVALFGEKVGHGSSLPGVADQNIQTYYEMVPTTDTFPNQNTQHTPPPGPAGVMLYSLFKGRESSWAMSRSEIMSLDTRYPLGVSVQRPSSERSAR